MLLDLVCLFALEASSPNPALASAPFEQVPIMAYIECGLFIVLVVTGLARVCKCCFG